MLLISLVGSDIFHPCSPAGLKIKSLRWIYSQMWSSLPFSKKTSGVILVFVFFGGVGTVTFAAVHQVINITMTTSWISYLQKNSAPLLINVAFFYNRRTSSTDSGSNVNTNLPISLHYLLTNSPSFSSYKQVFLRVVNSLIAL